MTADTREVSGAQAPAARRHWRRWTVAVVLVLLAVAAGVELGGRANTGSGDRPASWNVLLVTFDTTRSDHLSCYGYEHIETPAIDLMARNGLRYERCYSPAPLTLPAHTSIMTGLYPFYHGLRNNGTGPLDGSIITLAEVLKQQGYKTGAVIAASVLEAQYGLDQGFDYYSGEFDADTESRFEYASRRAAAVTDDAIDWLKDIGDARFFLWVHYYDPHTPHAPPEYDQASAIGSPYDLEIAYADGELDRLLKYAGQLKHATKRSTMIILTADHGEALWDHGEPTHGLFAYDECLRVPLIVYLPRDTVPRGVIETPVSLADIFPSVLAWMGIPLPHEVHGRVLPSNPAGQDGSAAATRPLYFEAYLPYATYGWSPLEGVVVGDEKFISAPQPEMYDLAQDPRESENLFATDDPRVARLRGALEELRGAPLDTPAVPAASATGDHESVRKLMALGYTGGFELGDVAAENLADPKDCAELHRDVTRAQSEIENDAFAAGLALLEDVLERDPLNPRATFLVAILLGEADIREQALELALRLAERAQRPPLDAVLPLHIGTAFAQQGQPEEAARWIHRAIEAAPDSAEAYCSLGKVLLAHGQADAAIRHARKASELEPDNIRYLLALARAYEWSQDYEEASQLYDRALEIKPNDHVLLNNSAWAYYQLRQQPGVALERSRRAVSISPENPQLRDTLACILLWSDQPEEAAAQLLKAIDLDGGYAVAHYHLGLALERLGDRAGARTALKRAVELAGKPPPQWLGDARTRLSH